jgi:hypothetical protein
MYDEVMTEFALIGILFLNFNELLKNGIPWNVPKVKTTSQPLTITHLHAPKSIHIDLFSVTSPQGAIINTNGALKQCS